MDQSVLIVCYVCGFVYGAWIVGAIVYVVCSEYYERRGYLAGVSEERHRWETALTEVDEFELSCYSPPGAMEPAVIGEADEACPLCSPDCEADECPCVNCHPRK